MALLSTAHAAINHTGITGVGSASTFALKTADTATTSATMADITDLTASVLASSTYIFRAVLFFYTAATTTGARFSVNGPASPTAIKFGGQIASAAPGNAVGFASSYVAAYDSPIVATTSGPGAANSIAIIEGVFINGSNAGTLAMRWATEVAASAVNVDSRSYFQVTKV